jgi:hypothetical protein
MVIANLLVCTAGMIICACRMSHMSKSRTKIQIRLSYSMWFTTFMASGISWTYGDPANLAQLSMSVAILLNLIFGISVWRYGQPHYAMKAANDYGD